MSDHDEDDKGLRATTITIGDDELVVISFPLVPEELEELTPAESEVAQYVVMGLSNAQIAERRGTARRTVANQLASIFEKLGVSSRTELVHAIADPDNR